MVLCTSTRLSRSEQGNQTCTAATHAEWGRYKVPQQPSSARGDNFPSTEQRHSSALQVCSTEPRPRMERLLTSCFTFTSPSNFSLVRFLTRPPPLCRLHLNPRPFSGRLFISQFTLLYHSAVQPCKSRVGLHIQELFIARFFISPACGGDRRNHAHQILTSALFCCKIYWLC